MQNTTADATATSCMCAPSTALHAGAPTPFADGGNVVANTAVGFGPPETVTVGAPAAGEAGAEPLLASTMEKRCEEAYMTPCVELRKSR